MTLYGPSDSSGRRLAGNLLIVDGDTIVTNGNGSPEAPFATITLALAAAAAGDEILIRPAAAGYVEDLTLVDGVSLKAIGEGLVTVTGTATANNVGCTIEGIAFIDDGAGSCLDITGANAETINLAGCQFTATATGDQIMTLVNTNQTLNVVHCSFSANVANANEAILIGNGTAAFTDCSITHLNNTVDAVLCSGAAAATVNFEDCVITGSIESAAAVVAPTVVIRGGSVTVGAVSAGIIAATCTQTWEGVVVSSADAGNLAFDGAGNINVASCVQRGTASAVAGTLTPTYEVTTEQKLHPPNVWYVDVSYAGTEEYGSEICPFAAIQDAHDAANAGDLIIVEPGAYTEDLAWTTDVDLRGNGGPNSSAVIVTGTATFTDVSCGVANMEFIDDTAGGAVHVTGTGADVMTFHGCCFDGTATGDYALEADNTNATLRFRACDFAMAGGANPCVIIESGTVHFRDCDFDHVTTTAQALEAQGDAATTITARDCYFTGTVDTEAAAVNPACRLDNCSITAGAVSGINIAAGNTVVTKNVDITCTDAANDAVDGAGTITMITPLVFLGAADEIPATITATHYLDSRIQHGTVAAAGASPQTDTVTLPQPMPDVNYDIILTSETTGGAADDTICSVDQGTIAVGGFDVITTNAAAGAVGCNIHWVVIHD